MTKILVVCGGAGRGLLGQREALGFAAELQLDVHQELLPVENDEFAWRIPVDAAVLTTKSLLDEMNERWGKSATGTAQGRHAKIMYQGYPGGTTNLDTGLGQSPAIGGGAIRNSTNESMLRTTVGQIVGKIGQHLGQDNQIDIWIVSSTAGGTGAGIRRFVATIIAQEVGTQFQNCVVKIHFLLYGARTYTSINAHRTSLNTFMSVAQDTAFVDAKFNLDNEPVRFFYYLEIPDVGAGDRARKEREKLVEITSRAVFLKELREQLEVVANNSPNKTVFVRVGFWDGELPKEQLYYETLKQLRVKLAQLTEPDVAKFTEGFDCDLDSPELSKAMEAIKPELMLLDRQWQFPSKPPEWFRKPSEKEYQDYVVECEKALTALLEKTTSRNIPARIMGLFVPRRKESAASQASQASASPSQLPLQTSGTTSEQTETERLSRPLAIAKPGANIDWAQKQDLIVDAHRVLAWCHKLLYRPTDGLPLTQQQIDLCKECSDIQNRLGAGSRDKATRLAQKLPRLLDATVRLRLLRELMNRAQVQLNELQTPFLRVKAKVEGQEQMMLQAGVVSQTTNLVLATDLSRQVTVTNPRSWIEILDRAEQSKKDDQFRRAVESGATGLTMRGLSKVLGLDAEEASEIRAEIMNKAGGILINKEKTQGIWWQANGSIWHSGDDRHQYRVLPWLNDHDWAALRGEATGNVELIRTNLGAIGLRVLAMDMVNIGKRDMAKAAEMLLKDLRTHLTQELEDWPSNNVPVRDRVINGVLWTAASGVGGEPLDLIALERIGLDKTELTKLEYLYELHKLTPETPPEVPTSSLASSEAST